jgi:putative transposase
MIMVKHFEIKPTQEQSEKLFHTLTLCRKLYNFALDQRITTYKTTGKGITYSNQQNQLPQFKKDNPEYKNIQSQALQDVLRRLDTAYKNFFEKRGGYPKFKDRFHYNSFTIPQSEADRNFGKNGYIFISKIGNIKLNAHQGFDKSEVKIINIKHDSGKWYVNLTLDIPEPSEIEKTGKSVGIDMGIKEFAITSDGKMYENPKWLNKSEKKLKKLQRQLSRKTKGSSNRNKAKSKLAKVHSKVSNQRKDYLHKVSLEIVRTYDTICIEDLQTSNMMKNHKLAKAISNVGWHKFSVYLDYKSKYYGKTLIKVNPKNTSQKCSHCGEIVKKSLAVRVHKCPHCGLVMDRDINAAKNILSDGLKLIA